MIDVVVILGSKSDKEIAKKAIGIFDRFGIEYTITVASAHRTPARLADIIENTHKTMSRYLSQLPDSRPTFPELWLQVR